MLQMFKECVFGYYVLTPLIEAKEVSDIKVLDYNHIVVKAKGKRYIADCSFYSPSDYNDWFMRILRIQGWERVTMQHYPTARTEKG